MASNSADAQLDSGSSQGNDSKVTTATATVNGTVPSPAPSAGWTDPDYKPPEGRLGNLTEAQQHALDTFRKELQDEGHFVPERMDDASLLR